MKRRSEGWGKGVKGAMDGGVGGEEVWDGTVKQGAGAGLGSNLKHSHGKCLVTSLLTT